MTIGRKPRLYLDTSAVGAFYDTEDPHRVKIVTTFFEKIKKGDYEAFISRLFVEEITRAPEEIKEGLLTIIKDLDPPVLEETEETITLAHILVREGVIPEKFRDDARHLALAIFYELDLLVSWNYRHMVNIRVKKLVNSVSLRLGFKSLDIVSPEEVIEYEKMES